MTPSKAPLPFLGPWKPTKCDTLSGVTLVDSKMEENDKHRSYSVCFLGERAIGADSYRAAQLS